MGLRSRPHDGLRSRLSSRPAGCLSRLPVWSQRDDAAGISLLVLRPARRSGEQETSALALNKKVYLRGALNLTDAQKPAFEAYFGAVDAYHQMKRPQGVQGQTRQDILNQRLAFQKTRVEALQKAIDTRQELMKVLTPEQVKVFDAVESRTHARGPRGGFGPGHRGYHHGGYGMMYQQGVPAPQGQQQGGRL
mgnify:CR=1 FL=1